MRESRGNFASQHSQAETFDGQPAAAIPSRELPEEMIAHEYAIARGAPSCVKLPADRTRGEAAVRNLGRIQDRATKQPG